MELSSFMLAPILLGLLPLAGGIGVLSMRTPLVYRTRWLFLVILACCLPLGGSPWVVVPLVITGVLAWFLAPGFSVVGVGARDMEGSLREALTNLGHEFEMSPDGPRLRVPEVQLGVSEGLGGLWSLAAKPRGHDGLLVAVVQDLRRQYATGRVAVQRSSAVALLILGALFLTVGVWEALTLGRL